MCSTSLYKEREREEVVVVVVGVILERESVEVKEQYIQSSGLTLRIQLILEPHFCTTPFLSLN